jgi:hypothetical protein
MADPQVTLDIGGAVSAGVSAVQAVQNLLTGSRSATIEIDNNTGLTLTLYNSTLDHGGWVKGPDPVIGPMTPTVFGSQNLGGSVMTGTQASVQYISDDSLLWLWVGWDNPYIGSNKAGASLGWANADQYMIRFIVGSGNTQAQFRFLLLPNPGSVYARIKNITQGQSFL